jgi:two-component system sensor histidine kinase YesM
VDEALKSMEFPRLILQPVVENAVIHGIEPKDGRGYISIEGGKDESGYVLRIEDTGVGMDDDRLTALQRRLEQSDNQDNISFGLWNVNQRLKLMFGEASGLSVGRREGGGTAVWIVIRRKGEERDVPHLDR